MSTVTKRNPLTLNPLQLRTLALFQRMSQLEAHVGKSENGEITVTNFPHAHGDHFHLGDAVIGAREASGLTNEAAWIVLERKGLIKSIYPYAATLTQNGLSYETGIAFTQTSDH